YHEGGHALVAAALNNSAPVTKVTILPRGQAGGYTMVVPTQDRNYQSRNELLDRLAYAMGGYAVEESIFHDVTTGPSNDLQQATKIARTMVMQLGMTSSVGQIALSGDQDEVFVGMQQGQAPRFSAETASLIDKEVRALLDNALDEAWAVIVENRHVLDRLVAELLERETLNEHDLAEIFADGRKRPLREVWTSSSERPTLEAPKVGGPTTATGTEEHDAGEPMQPHPAELPHPAGDDPEIPGAAREGAPDGTGCRAGRASDMPVDQPRVQAAVREILAAIGGDPDREGLQDTPARVARMYQEVFFGLDQDAQEPLATTFDIDHQELVLVRDIGFHSMCEHHLLPFFGIAHVGYIPAAGNGSGLRKLARLVHVYARRPQVQERITSQIADALMDEISASG